MILQDRYITTESVENLRDNTPVGSFIKFKRTRKYGESERQCLRTFDDIHGIVTTKYSHIFVLDDGRTYSWVDYILGK